MARAPAFLEFLALRQAHQIKLSYEASYVLLLGGDHAAALMLSTIVDQYQQLWVFQSKFEEDAPWLPVCPPFLEWKQQTWLHLTWGAWFQLTLIPEKTAARRLRRLKDLGLLVVKNKPNPAGGSKMLLQLDTSKFLEKWELVLSGHPPDFQTDHD